MKQEIQKEHLGEHMSLALSFLPEAWMAGTVFFHLEIPPTFEGMSRTHQDTELEWRLGAKSGPLGASKFLAEGTGKAEATGGLLRTTTHTFHTCGPRSRSSDK